MSCGTCQVVAGGQIAPGVPAAMAAQQRCPKCGQFVGAAGSHVCPNDEDDAYVETEFVVMGSSAGVPDPGSVRVLTNPDQAEAARRELCAEYGLDPDSSMGESAHCVTMVEVQAERPTQALTFDVDGEVCTEANVLDIAWREFDKLEPYEIPVGLRHRFRGSNGKTYAVFASLYLAEVEPDEDEVEEGWAEAENILTGALRELGGDYWEDGYTEAEANAGCERLSRAARAMGLPGDVCVVWEHCDMYGFGGDSSLCYIAPDGRGCELETMPFLSTDEGDAQAAEFLDELEAVSEGQVQWQEGLGQKHRDGYNVAWHYSPDEELG